MKGKKVIHWGVVGENGGTIQILSWKCNFNIYLDIQVYYLTRQVYYLDIQAITTLLCYIGSLCVASFYSFKLSMLQLLSWKVTCSGTQKPKAPRVLDLQEWE